MTEIFGDDKGESGDTGKEGRSLFLGRSGVRKVDSEHGGGQDCGRSKDSEQFSDGKLTGDTVLPRFSNKRCFSSS